jgi:predicted Zn-dependent protease
VNDRSSAPTHLLRRIALPGGALARGAALTLAALLASPTQAIAHPPSTRQRAHLHQHLRQHPGDVSARVRHSALLERAGRAPEALAELDRALALRPSDPALQVSRAQMLLALGRGDEAATTLARIPESKHDAAYHLVAARVARARADEGEMNAHYRTSLSLSPSLTVAFEYGAWLEEKGRNREAVRMYDEQLSRNGGAAVLRLSLIRVLGATGEHARALEHIERLLSAAQLKAEYRILRARALDGLGRRGEAAEERRVALGEAEAAYQRRPSTQRLALRGRARCEHGQSVVGLTDLQQAAHRAPTSLLIRQWLEEARTRCGGAP